MGRRGTCLGGLLEGRLLRDKSRSITTSESEKEMKKKKKKGLDKVTCVFVCVCEADWSLGCRTGERSGRRVGPQGLLMYMYKYSMVHTLLS